MSKIRRRDVLKGAAAASLASMAGAGELLAGGGQAFAAGSSGAPKVSPHTAAALPTTAGTSYRSFSGYDFKTPTTATGFTFAGFSGINWTGGGDGAFHVHLDIPNTALVSQTQFYVLNTSGHSILAELNG